jgi:hypothetical protein
VDEDAFNMSVRRFLKKLGVSAQREIELSVREQLEAGELRRMRRSRQEQRSSCRASRAKLS